MIGSFIGGLITAWILVQFEASNIIITGVNDLFKIKLTEPGFYVICGIIGMLTFLVQEWRCL